MDFYRACLKKIRACPFLKATGLGLFHDFFFLEPCITLIYMTYFMH